MTPRQLKAARALAGLSQRALAAAANLAPSTVIDFERGERQAMIRNNVEAVKRVLAAHHVILVQGGAVMADRFACDVPNKTTESVRADK